MGSIHPSPITFHTGDWTHFHNNKHMWMENAPVFGLYKFSPPPCAPPISLKLFAFIFHPASSFSAQHFKCWGAANLGEHIWASDVKQRKFGIDANIFPQAQVQYYRGKYFDCAIVGLCNNCRIEIILWSIFFIEDKFFYWALRFMLVRAQNVWPIFWLHFV